MMNEYAVIGWIYNMSTLIVSRNHFSLYSDDPIIIVFCLILIRLYARYEHTKDLTLLQKLLQKFYTNPNVLCVCICISSCIFLETLAHLFCSGKHSTVDQANFIRICMKFYKIGSDVTVLLLKNNVNMSKQRKGTGSVRSVFSPESAGILPCHLCCL